MCTCTTHIHVHNMHVYGHTQHMYNIHVHMHVCTRTLGGSLRLLSSKWETWNSQNRESTETCRCTYVYTHTSIYRYACMHHELAYTYIDITMLMLFNTQLCIKWFDGHMIVYVYAHTYRVMHASHFYAFYIHMSVAVHINIWEVLYRAGFLRWFNNSSI